MDNNNYAQGAVRLKTSVASGEDSGHGFGAWAGACSDLGVPMASSRAENNCCLPKAGSRLGNCTMRISIEGGVGTEKGAPSLCPGEVDRVQVRIPSVDGGDGDLTMELTAAWAHDRGKGRGVLSRGRRALASSCRKLGAEWGNGVEGAELPIRGGRRGRRAHIHGGAEGSGLSWQVVSSAMGETAPTPWGRMALCLGASAASAHRSEAKQGEPRPWVIAPWEAPSRRRR
ncbi:hypothetical protein ZEAMMB73_Zm00001d031363 [Zea mays]|jgi:hypothetical protein|uniref:Uncharacterized protein n=1 Tax=Zea mays TaxID=4577 RepID=A0A1D6KIG2_MAIZE|nr:hypothetical protein ZEAMMB73_Zm00001d031363 [Zea mays]